MQLPVTTVGEALARRRSTAHPLLVCDGERLGYAEADPSFDVDGVDAALMVHPAGLDLSRFGAIAIQQLEVTYHGRAAHAAAAPQAGRNALDAAVLDNAPGAAEARIAAVADLMLFDAENPRSLVFQLDRLRANLRAMPGASGSSRPERLAEEMMTRVRRLDPHDLEHLDEDGRRADLAGLLDGVHTGLRELSTVITDTQLSLPGGMQPLWGPDQLRVLP